MSGDRDDAGEQPQGAILNDDQIKRLKAAIIVMSALLVIGIITLIARVIYLASGRPGQAGDATLMAASTATPPVLSDLTVALPAGASVKSASLQGSRMLLHYVGGKGDGVLILDLASGRTISHIRMTTGPN